MTNFKTLTLATVAAVSLGVGGAMARESAGGADAISRPAFGWTAPAIHAAPVTGQPQAGSADVDPYRAPVYPRQTLIGADGND